MTKFTNFIKDEMFLSVKIKLKNDNKQINSEAGITSVFPIIIVIRSRTEFSDDTMVLSNNNKPLQRIIEKVEECTISTFFLKLRLASTSANYLCFLLLVSIFRSLVLSNDEYFVSMMGFSF